MDDADDLAERAAAMQTLRLFFTGYDLWIENVRGVDHYCAKGEHPWYVCRTNPNKLAADLLQGAPKPRVLLVGEPGWVR